MAADLNAHCTTTGAKGHGLRWLEGCLRQAAMKGIAEDKNLASDEERQRAKSIVGQLLDVLEETAKLGKSDGGAVLMMKPDAMTMAAGALIADGKKLEDGVKKLAAFARERARRPWRSGGRRSGGMLTSSALPA